jgi:drug/metabolite transporter (DMT)-like permease
MGLMLYLIPVVCVLAGAGFLGEPLTGQIIAGGALTVFGVWVASRVAGDTSIANAASESSESSESAG